MSHIQADSKCSSLRSVSVGNMHAQESSLQEAVAVAGTEELLWNTSRIVLEGNLCITKHPF